MKSPTHPAASQSKFASSVSLAAVVMLAAWIAWMDRHPPRLGDDLDYWMLAMELRLGEPGAWNPNSFHDLRWPVWGLCWLLMGGFGITSASYFLQPFLYMAGGAAVVWALAGAVGFGPLGRFAAGAVFLLHPLLDVAISRPMPDLSEGFWTGLALLSWMGAMRESSAGRKVAWSAAVGLALAVAQANRVTGVFAVPALVVCTLALAPRQFGWLVLCGVFAAGFVLVEWMIYWFLTGDFLASLHANLGARGRRGTEAMPIWEFPIRFLPQLFRQPPDTLLTLLALSGAGWFAWKGPPAGRAVALYAAVYFLAYSCAPQSLNPLRPMVRDGERFLAALALPFSVLAVGGVCLLQIALASCLPRASCFLQKYAAWLLGIGLLLLAGLGNRTRGEPDYLAEIREQVLGTPQGTTILSHRPMRAVAQMAEPSALSRFDWRLHKALLEPSQELEALLPQARRIWLIRKHAWLGNRKRSESGKQARLPALAAFLVPPFSGWAPERSILKGDVPDFLFLSRSRNAPEQVVSAPWMPGLPARWNLKAGDWFSGRQLLDPTWKGREVMIFLRGRSDHTEPVHLRLEFFGEGDEPTRVLTFKPYFFRETSPDFFAFRIPEWARAWEMRIRTFADSGSLHLETLEMNLFPSSANPGEGVRPTGPQSALTCP